MPTDKSPIVIKEFKGRLLTDEDQFGVTVGVEQTKIPFEYSLDNHNLVFLKKGGLRTRDGIERYVNLANVTGKPLQMWKINSLNGDPYTDRWLILTWDGTNGRLYDTGVVAPATNPVLNLVGMKYAFVANIFNRMYISPWSAWANPLNGGSVIVYNGLYNARLAGCALPVNGAPAFAAGAAAGGNCTPGLHLCSVLYETDTGYISSCIAGQSLTPVPVTTTAANATINFTNIPTGPAGTGVVKRHIIISKLVVNNNGQGFNSYEPFFAVTINDNTTVGPVAFTGPDSSLLQTAKNYINDGTAPNQLVDRIPACVSLATYGNRLVVIGPVNTALILIIPGGVLPTPYDQILVSPANKPEQIDTSQNLFFSNSYRYNGLSAINIAAQFSGKPMAGGELSGVFYVFKKDCTFAVIADDAKDPNEWAEPQLVDSGKGAFPFGVSYIGNNPSSNNDGSMLVCGNHGITYFNGRFSQRSMAEAIWDEYRIADLKWSKVIVDPIRQLMFLRFGDPNSDELTFPAGINTTLFVANFYFGMDITSIRWGAWRYTVDHNLDPLLTIADIDLREPGTAGNVGGAANFSTMYSLLSILTRKSLGGGLYDINIHSEAIADRDFYTSKGVNGVFPSWYYETGFTPNENGEVFNFGPLKLRLRVDAGGVSNAVNFAILVEKCLFDSSTFANVAQFNAVAFPGKYYSANLNAVSEHLRLRISGQNRVLLDKLVLYMTKVAEDRPRV